MLPGVDVAPEFPPPGGENMPPAGGPPGVPPPGVPPPRHANGAGFMAGPPPGFDPMSGPPPPPGEFAIRKERPLFSLILFGYSQNILGNNAFLFINYYN